MGAISGGFAAEKPPSVSLISEIRRTSKRLVSFIRLKNHIFSNQSLSCRPPLFHGRCRFYLFNIPSHHVLFRKAQHHHVFLDRFCQFLELFRGRIGQ